MRGLIMTLLLSSAACSGCSQDPAARLREHLKAIEAIQKTAKTDCDEALAKLNAYYEQHGNEIATLQTTLSKRAQELEKLLTKPIRDTFYRQCPGFVRSLH